MKHPSIRELRSVIEGCNELKTCINDQWVPARPQTTVASLRNRIRAAWLVFTGRADALIWPGGQ